MPRAWTYYFVRVLFSKCLGMSHGAFPLAWRSRRSTRRMSRMRSTRRSRRRSRRRKNKEEEREEEEEEA